MHKNRLLFLTILIEGYVVLSCELLAIRQSIPFVGSGVETISIIISAVLLPLAVGYHAGGGAFQRSCQHSRQSGHPVLSIRKILLRNILVSLIMLTLGLSYSCLEGLFRLMESAGITGRMVQTAIYSALFIATPVFLLAQTIPLISNYLPQRKLSAITGKMFFFSTLGSFLGSVFSTIVLMSFIGVHNTVIVTLGLLGIMGLLLCREKQSYLIFISALAIVIALNSNYAMRDDHIVSDNAYNIVKVLDLPDNDITLLTINRGNSSAISKNPDKRFEYVKYIEHNFIEPAPPGGVPRNILIIGAGGFTMGLNDTVNHYTFVDIDKDLKKVAEQDFLKRKLSPNKQFIASSARAFVRRDSHRYDLIILDTYTHTYAVPMECTTRDFLLDVKRLLKNGGIVVANIAASSAFHEKFAVRYDNTFSSVFPVHTRQVLNPDYPLTSDSINMANVLYIYYNNAFANDRTIYTDDKNTYSLDRP